MEHFIKSNPGNLSSSKEVRDFYERYPYPGPLDNLDKYRQRPDDRQRKLADHFLYKPHIPFTEDSSVLIAGCGTSQAAKHAMRLPGSKVTGIDFSETSVNCTLKLKKKYELNNLEVHRLEIEKVNELGLKFDKIICTGVLHHLKDPDAGLSALREVLKPGGAMQLMVYAPYGRAGIYMMQEFCRLAGISANEKGIHDLTEILRSLPPGHPLEKLIRDAPDFLHDGSIADSLLNPQDRAYTVTQLFELVKNAGMKFVRWVRQAPYSYHCGVMSQLPVKNDISKLTQEEQFSAAELFRGTMVRHSIIAYRNDDPSGTQQVSFKNDNINIKNEWLKYIPIRVPETICITDRLPKDIDAAAVLINRTHAYRDLILPIGKSEKKLFDSIDGIKSIGEITDGINDNMNNESITDPAAKFFEQLWWYDQVVFNTSEAGNN
ncbi:MAG: class I SAM-dependent methyltransferase [Ignavibacteriae bacterium]|nr:class I SAM-dependent methyltransferase [Ignavibacteriota bacterium]